VGHSRWSWEETVRLTGWWKKRSGVDWEEEDPAEDDDDCGAEAEVG
jgi:hypothetical protein